MSTLERRLDLINSTIQNRLALGRVSESNPDNLIQKPISITPELFSSKLAQLKKISNSINIEEFRGTRLLTAQNKVSTEKTEKASDNENILNEISNPYKNVLDKLPGVNGSIQRAYQRLRRSGCRCTDKENMETSGCRSRFCAKKQKKTGLGNQQRRSGHANIVAISAIRKTNTQPKLESSKRAA